jgi:hypothetical protein
VVTLDSPAEKVYGTVLATVAEHADYRYLTRNDAARSIEVTNGRKSAGVHVIAMDDKLSQLIIASTIQPGETSPSLRLAERAPDLREDEGDMHGQYPALIFRLRLSARS